MSEIFKEEIKGNKSAAEGTAEGSDTGFSNTGTSIVDQAIRAGKTLEQELERLEKNLAELREFEAKSLLSGTAGGRIEPMEVTEAKLRKNQALEFWRGTSIADAIDKQPL